MATISNLSPHKTRVLRMRAQRLAPSVHSEQDIPAKVLKDVVAVQTQDIHAGRLSIRARSTGLTAAQVDEARQGERSIVWTWSLRGTLHLMTAEDTRWLVPMLGPALIAGSRGRRRQLGWNEENETAGLRLLRKELEKREGLTRDEVAQMLGENGLPFKGQATAHLLYRAGFEGLICFGANRGKKPTYTLFEKWLEKPVLLPRPDALAKLARRYLAAYAPASPTDLAAWAGLSLGEARQAWKLIGEDLLEVNANGQPAWILKNQEGWLEEKGSSPLLVNLLPRFDTYLLGYASRELAVEKAYTERIKPGGGMIAAVVLVDGRTVGIWRTVQRSKRLEVQVEAFEHLPDEEVAALEEEAADVGLFLETDAKLLIQTTTL